MRFVAAVVASFALACGARPAGSFHVNALGTVASFEDESPVDGPIRFTVATDEGRSYRFFFESMYTRPSPTAERRALFEKLQGTKVGDQVHASGKPHGDHFSLESFERL
jgi:hypothetical protein